jgi:hypothetical protein
MLHQGKSGNPACMYVQSRTVKDGGNAIKLRNIKVGKLTAGIMSRGSGKDIDPIKLSRSKF